MDLTSASWCYIFFLIIVSFLWLCFDIGLFYLQTWKSNCLDLRKRKSPVRLSSCHLESPDIHIDVLASRWQTFNILLVFVERFIYKVSIFLVFLVCLYRYYRKYILFILHVVCTALHVSRIYLKRHTPWGY